MAEVIARRRARDLSWDQLEVRSAGVAAFDGASPSGGAVRAAAEHDLDLTAHSSTLLTQEEASGADLILTMSASQLMRVMELGSGDRAAMLTSFAGATSEGLASGEIPDPVGGPDEEYQETFQVLDELIERVLHRLGAVIAP